MSHSNVSFRRSVLATAIGSILIAPSVFAADEPPKAQEIETTIVVGSATNTIITSEQLESYQANDLADVFRLTPSISVGGSLGIAQKIYVRGLEDNYINVTVDGAPQTGTLFHHIGRVTIDPELLQEVEVQSGAGEATAGAGAIGGAIRFKTKNVDDVLESGKAIGGKLKAGYMSNSGEQYSASLYGRFNDDWGAIGYFNKIDRDNFEDGDGDEVLGTASDQTLGFIKFSGHIDDNQFLSLSYEDRDEKADFSSRPNWQVRPIDTLYESKATRETTVFNYALDLNEAVELELTLYDTESSYSGGRFDYQSEIATQGFDIRNTSGFGNHTVTYGVDYRQDDINSGGVGDPIAASEEGTVLGVYVQAKSQLTDALLLSYGARYDDYEFEQVVIGTVVNAPSTFDESDVSLNAGLSYQLTDALSFGVGYAEAFRGKEVGDGFTIDSVDVVIPVPNGLKGESVSNVEASVKYEADRLKVELAIYESEIEDALFSQLYSRGVYDNIGDVTTRGGELEIEYNWEHVDLFVGYAKINSTLGPRAGYYTQDFGTVDLESYEFRHLGNSLGDTWTVGVEYRITNDIKTGLNLKHVEDLSLTTLYQDHDQFPTSTTSLYELEKDGYTTVDVFAEWDVTEAFSVHLAVINLFDEQCRDHASTGDYTEVPGYGLVVGPWESGRDIRLSVSYEF